MANVIIFCNLFHHHLTLINMLMYCNNAFYTINEVRQSNE